MSKVSAREVAQMQALSDERAGVAGLVQCPGCPGGGKYRPDPNYPLIDGCSSHSTANYYATCRDATMPGGQL